MSSDTASSSSSKGPSSAAEASEKIASAPNSKAASASEAVQLPASPPTPEPEGSNLPEIPAEPVTEIPMPVAPWREELAGRLKDHRKRRTRLQGQFDASGTLDLAFGEPAAKDGAEPLDADLDEAVRQRSDMALPASQEDLPVLDSAPIDDVRVLISAAMEAGETVVEKPRRDAERVEIILESSSPSASDSNPHHASGSAQVALLSRRFMAGLADALILLLGGGLFSLIFWVVGGHVSRSPVDMVVVGSISVLFILVYFGVFTALSSATPGLLWMNLEVQSLEGGAPSAKESFWRAFGYLVSMTSLMLGFVWAVVDGDHLTWHDHMSGTFITTIRK